MYSACSCKLKIVFSANSPTVLPHEPCSDAVYACSHQIRGSCADWTVVSYGMNRSDLCPLLNFLALFRFSHLFALCAPPSQFDCAGVLNATSHAFIGDGALLRVGLVNPTAIGRLQSIAGVPAGVAAGTDAYLRPAVMRTSPRNVVALRGRGDICSRYDTLIRFTTPWTLEVVRWSAKTTGIAFFSMSLTGALEG